MTFPKYMPHPRYKEYHIIGTLFSFYDRVVIERMVNNRITTCPIQSQPSSSNPLIALINQIIETNYENWS